MNRPNWVYAHVPERHIEFNAKILKAMKEVLTEEILSNPDGIKLPHGMGELKILRYIPKTTPVDRATTKKVYGTLKGKTIKFDNSFTDGFVFKLFWVKTNYAKSIGFHTSKLFYFKSSITFNKALKNYIKDVNWNHFHISLCTASDDKDSYYKNITK